MKPKDRTPLILWILPFALLAAGGIFVNYCLFVSRERIGWLGWTVFAFSAVSAFAAIWLRSRVARRQFIASRPPLNDQAFLDCMGSRSHHGEVIVKLRRAFGKLNGIPPEAIYPDDQLGDFEVLHCDGVDTIEWLLCIEDAFQIRKPDSFWKKFNMPRHVKVADHFQHLIERLDGSSRQEPSQNCQD